MYSENRRKVLSRREHRGTDLVFWESTAMPSAATKRDFMEEEYEHAVMSPRIPLSLESTVSKQCCS